MHLSCGENYLDGWSRSNNQGSKRFMGDKNTQNKLSNYPRGQGNKYVWLQHVAILRFLQMFADCLLHRE